MNAGSTFSGIGGLDLGLERAGIRIHWQAESDAYCRRVLAERFPGVACHHDVRDVARGDGIRLAAGQPARRPAPDSRAHEDGGSTGGVDLVCGGFPCQDLSVAGKRRGLAGERSGLFYEFARIVDALRPAWLLLENVPGLLSSNAGRDFGVVLGTLAELGYGLAWRVLDSRYFGVAQRRRRVFVVGRLGGDRRSALSALCESCEGSPTASRSTWQTPPAGARGRVSRSLNARSRCDGESESFVTHALTASQGTTEDGTGRGTPLVEPSYWIEDGENATLLSGGHAGTPPRTDRLPLLAFSVTPEGGQGSDLRATQVDTANALDATSQARSTERGVRITSSSGVRRLTPRECERLQGFPDDWTLIPGATDSRRYGALGNAVTTNVSEWIGRRILAVEAQGGT